ncbi:hypothetical protein BC343_09085 [Mucilaginibacter pedocola]|uniref:DUF4407 domain-containing protein n=1 Tax=Mucilaginibacter pedocola TaxID=1792845 RepID=A0A1S9PCT1_9SPHI|nr:hypothetical protein BC343_09085 [Mucilaginibacter pedocola]
MWSGAEIGILKDCPTDYNRQASIGFTIFMTTMLAFCSGSYAGWYFGQTYATAFIFGGVWAALIFSIDRSMVITLKKDPDAIKQKFWLPFSSRAVLAVLVAFIISIPLELLIFQEEIQANMLFFKEKQTNRLLAMTDMNSNLATSQKQHKIDSIEAARIESLLSLDEPRNNSIYTALKSDHSQRLNEYTRLTDAARKARANSVVSWARIPVVDGYKDMNTAQAYVYRRYKQVSDARRAELRRFDLQGLRQALADKNDFLKRWREENEKNKKKADSNKEKTAARVEAALKNRDDKKHLQDSLTKDSKGFITRFMVLEDLASFKNQKDNPSAVTVFWFLWLIRVLFFVIEVLPTIAKIATPVGAYDIAISAKEKDIEQDLLARTDDYLAEQKSLRTIEHDAVQTQLQDRIEIESELHKLLLTEIAAAQEEVARQKLDAFKREHLLNKGSEHSVVGGSWHQENITENVEYFFRDGALGPLQQLFILNEGALTTGTWEYTANQTGLELVLQGNQLNYFIARLTRDRLTLLKEGGTEVLAFSKLNA